jgi:hypothetical protein
MAREAFPSPTLFFALHAFFHSSREFPEGVLLRAEALTSHRLFLHFGDSSGLDSVDVEIFFAEGTLRGAF